MVIRDESKYRKAVAREIDRAIRESGMTAVEVGVKMGVSGQTIGRWRSGDDIPRPKYRAKLERVLKMPGGRINTLYGGGASELDELRTEVDALRAELAELATVVLDR